MPSPKSLKNLALVAFVAICACSQQPFTVPYLENDGRYEGATVGEFIARAVYVDDGSRSVGVRWVHTGSGMPVTLLDTRSVPQVFLSVHTPPVSDRGEPHAGEHLLLGKGRKGQILSATQSMSLTSSSASTYQTDVVYHWNCAAGKETFFSGLEQYLDALLLPDYTDEEIRREVCHYGVTLDPATGQLSVEEKGTVYNEMVASYEKRWNLWNPMLRRLWGPNHPHSWSSGGDPAALRATNPDHIREFHRDQLHPSPNLELIAALPPEIGAEEFLTHLSAVLARLEENPDLRLRPRRPKVIPAARPESDRSLKTVPFPHGSASEPGIALLAWAPVPLGSPREQLLAELFVAALAEGEQGVLHQRLIDGQTRVLEVDAEGVSGWYHTTTVDGAVFLDLSGFAPHQVAEESLVTGLLAAVTGEIQSLHGAIKEGLHGERLEDFNRRALAVLARRERELRKRLNSPPLFGHRRSGRFWLDHLRFLQREPGAKKPMTLAPMFADLRRLIDGSENPWRAVIERLGLREQPYLTVSVPSPQELSRLAEARKQRLAAFVDELTRTYETDDPQDALRQYRAAYAEQTAFLEARNRDLPTPRLVDDVPLNRDPTLVLEPMEIAEVPGHRGVFDDMTFTEVALAFRLDGVKPRYYPWLAALPALIQGVGVREGETTTPYDEMQRRWADEIYSLDASYDLRPSRGRHELLIRASGGDAEESLAAVAWIERVLRYPWIEPENVSRVLDIVAGEIRRTRGALGRAEEFWVRNPAAAIRHQGNPLFLSASSHYTKLLHLCRLEWWLTAPPDKTILPRVEKELTELVRGVGQVDDPHQFFERFIALRVERADDPAATWVVPIARRLQELLGDIPPERRTADLDVLSRIAVVDLQVPPAKALEELRATFRAVVSRTGCRFVLTGARDRLEALTPALSKLVAEMPVAEETAPPPPPAAGVVDSRLMERNNLKTPPVHYGIVGSGGSGVFVLSSSASGLDNLDETTLIGELAARVFSGGGTHSFFMQTWGAGLAYSNGLTVSPGEGRIRYYAERCPDLVETMNFVTGLVASKETLADPALAEYAVARAVSDTRASSAYESRTRSAAADLVDGETPEKITAYREAVLALRSNPMLWEKMIPQVSPMTGRVLPGLGPASRTVSDGAFVVIAPEPLLAKWEGWVKKHEGPQESVVRVWPRDFWVVPGLGGPES